MIIAAIIIILTIIFITIELPPLIKEKKLSSVILYVGLLGIGSTLIILYAFDVKLPNPLDGITYVFKPISTGIFNSLK